MGFGSDYGECLLLDTAGEAIFWWDVQRFIDSFEIGQSTLLVGGAQFIKLYSVPSNQPPIANAGDDQTDVPAGDDCTTSVNLDGFGSYDPDGDALTYTWTWDGSTESAVNPTIQLPLGTTTITLVVNDGNVDSEPDYVDITVIDNTPPKPDLEELPAVIGECSAEITSVPTATDNCVGTVSGTTTNPLIYTELGNHTVTWTYNDGNGNIATQAQTVVVEDTTPPVIESFTVDPNVLRPPNHKMIRIIPTTINVSDNCDPNPEIVLTITMNEGDEEDTYNPILDLNLGDGHTTNDMQVIDGFIYLRAERSGKGTGRVYTITYTATDASGNSATATATVTVPHDQK